MTSKEKILFNSSPQVNAYFFLERGKIKKITLSVSPEGFSASFNETPPSWLLAWLEGYAKGSPTPFPLSLLEEMHLSSYTKKVLQALCEIPFGSFLSYKELSIQLKHPKAARATGNACGHNPFPLLIPCHRVLHTTSSVKKSLESRLGGFFFDINIKKELLLFERSFLI